jgi:AsmA protein
MAKVLKLVAGLLVLVILLVTAAAVLAPLVLNPNDFRDDIEARVEAATGRKLAIGGDLDLSVFPWLAIQVKDASLSDLPPFGPEPLAELKRAKIRARLLPLLNGRLEVDRIELEGLHVHLIRNAQGKSNWESPPRESPAPGVPEDQLQHGSGTTERPPTSVETTAAPFAVAGVELVDARVDWDDQKSGHRVSVINLDLSTGPIAPGQAADLRLKAEAADARSGMHAQIAAEAKVALDPSLRRFTVRPLHLHITDLQAADGLSAKAEVEAGLEGDLAARRYVIDGLRLRGDAAGKPLGERRIAASLEGSADLDLGAETLSAQNVAIRSDALRITASVQGETLLSAPAFAGRIAVSELDLRAWLQQHGLPAPDTVDPGALRRFALEATWRFAGARLASPDLTVVLDQSRLTGSVAIRQTTPPGYRCDLAADKLDLDRYLPPTPASARASSAPGDTRPPPPTAQGKPAESRMPEALAPTSAPGAKHGADEVHIPVALLNTLDVDGRLRVGELRLAGLAFGDATLKVTAKDGNLSAANQISRFYGGRLDGRFGVDARLAIPVFTVGQRAVDIRVGPLLRDLMGEETVTGNGDLNAELTASGQSVIALRHTLGGNLGINLSQGAVRGFDIERMIREAGARLKGEPRPAAQGPVETRFTELRATAVVQNGVVNNNDLLATSDYLHVTGRGSVDLGNERFNYRLEPMFVKPPEGRALKELENVPIPVRLTGSFDDPKWSVELGDALKAVGKRELEKRLDEKGSDAIKKLEERTGIKGLEKGLRGLFGH